MPPESRANTSPRPGRLITRPGGSQGGTGASGTVRCSGRANRPARRASCLTTGRAATAANLAAAAPATVTVSARVLRFTVLTHFPQPARPPLQSMAGNRRDATSGRRALMPARLRPCSRYISQLRIATVRRAGAGPGPST